MLPDFTRADVCCMLQVKEVALMHSEGILAGEMKHGPLALVDENMPIIVIATRDRMHAKMQSVIQQLRARSARLIVLCNEGDDAIADLCSPNCRLIQVAYTLLPCLSLTFPFFISFFPDRSST